MKKYLLVIMAVLMLCVLAGCSKSTSNNGGPLNKKITLDVMKNEDTSYLEVNGKTMAFPFTLNEFFETFPEYDALNSIGEKIDLNQPLLYKTFIELNVIKKDGEEDEKTKNQRTRFRLIARVTSDNGDTLGNSMVTGVSYQHVDNYDFGIVKINGIEINKTTIGEVKKFFSETYGGYKIADWAVICDPKLTSTKFKKIDFWGLENYPDIYVSINNYSKNYEDTEIVDYVSVKYLSY